MKNSIKVLFVVLGLLVFSGIANSATLTAATGGGAIASNTTSGCVAAGTWTALTGPTITEANPGEIGLGTIVLSVPAGFQFNTASPVTILLAGNNTNTRNINDAANGSSMATSITATTITFTVTAVSTRTNTLTWQGIQVRPTASAPPATGSITETGTAATAGIANGTNYGTLTEVTSSPICNPAPFVCSPPSNVPAGVTVSCQCDTFARATLNPSTIFNSNWIVSTSDATGILPSIVNSGYLRLTNNTGNNAKAVTVPGIFPAAGNYISVEFQQYAYNGSNPGADGIAVTLSDYSVPAVPGAYGGSLGYAQETGIHDGFAGGWLGVGLDEYGNYQSSTEGRLGGLCNTAACRPQSVGARGSGTGQTNYRWLGGTNTLSPTIDNHTSTSASYGYFYQVVVDARNDPTSTSIAVNRDTGGGYVPLINIPNVYTAAAAQGFTQAPVPTNWQISFTGSTGGSNNIHEIGGLRICASTMVPPSGGSAGSFNAIDEAYGTPPLAVQNYLNGHIYTKLVGTSFKLNVAALSNSQIVTTYAAGGAKTVTVKLVDNSDSLADSTKDCTLSCTSTCTGKTAVTGGTQALIFVAGATDKGQKQSPSFTINTAVQKLVAIISDGTTSACSTDSFSVRPLSIATVTSSNATNAGATGAPMFKAGSDNFALTATTTGVAGSPSGYNGVLKVNSAVISSTASWAGKVTGTFPAATSATSQSTATGSTFAYSEVAGFTLPGYPVTDTTSRRGVYDGVATTDDCTTPGLTTAQCDVLRASTWTGVDSISTKNDCVLDSYSNVRDVTGSLASNPNYGKFGCNFGLVTTTAVIGRFIPDHFAVTANLIANRAEYGVTTGSITTGTGALTLAANVGVKVGDVISIAGAGVAGVAFSTTAASVSANGLTVTLAANVATTVANAPVGVGASTYMGEQMNAMFTLTAQSATNSTTINYAGSTWVKLDPKVAGVLNLGAINNPILPGVRVPLTARISTTGLLAVTGAFPSTCTPSTSTACLGIANVVAPFMISRGVNGDGPYSVLDVGIAPVDSDGVTTIYDLDTVNVTAGVNNHTTVDRTEVRYGRIKVSNSYGSELLPQKVFATAQYYTPTGWVNSITDSLTDVTLAATYPLLDKNNIATGSSTAVTRTPASGFLAGQLTINLAKPVGAAIITGTATINPTNNPAAAINYLPVTPGTATFGVYKNKNNFIYRRESY